MATLDWPAGRSFLPRSFGFGQRTAKSKFSGFFSGETMSTSHLGDRLRISLVLPIARPDDAGRREAFVMELVSAGHSVRLPHFLRPAPLGTLRGAPTVAVAALAGARVLQVQTTAAATLRPGDPLGALGALLLLTGYQGAVANGAGLMAVPLALPLRKPLAAGAALTWQRPTGLFQLAVDEAELNYSLSNHRWQDELELRFTEV